MKISKEMIDPKFLEELGIFEEELQVTGMSQYMEYPPSGCGRRFVMQHHWRGKSLRKHEPIIIRKNDAIDVVPISSLFKETDKFDQISLKGYEILTSNGFQSIKYAMRHRTGNQELLRIHTNRGIIEVTKDHSIFKNNVPIFAGDLKIGDIVDVLELPIIKGNVSVDQDLAWLLGLFLAEGHKHMDQAEITQNDQRVLLKVKEIVQKYGINAWISEDKVGFKWLPIFDDYLIPSHCQDRNYRPSYWKKVPSCVFTWNQESKEAFISGYLLGDGLHSKNDGFATTSKCLAQGIILILKSLGKEDFYTYLQELVSPSDRISKVYRITWVTNKHNRSLKPGTIRKIEKIFSNNPEIYVYDVETEIHDFQGGIGRIRAHNSVHKDFRMEMNNHLVGWTILDNPSGTPDVKTMDEAITQIKKLDWAFDFSKKNKGLRAETKARQPKEWLKVNGVVKPGEVGATKEETGVLDIVEHGVFWEGTQKPYFHEYFLKTDVGNFLPKDKWARIVFRGVEVPKIDPITKKPIKGQMEYMWKCMIPGNQIAYALQRGIKKGWKPPKGVIPIPPDQRSGELWDKWQAYMEGKTPTKESLRDLEGLPFAGFKNFKDCVTKIMIKKDINEKRASAYCAVIWRQTGQLSFKEWCKLNYPDEYMEYHIGDSD